MNKGLVCLMLLAMLSAQVSAASGIYTCEDASGKKISTDRVTDCNGTLTERGTSGAVTRIVPRVPTADEMEAIDKKKREVEALAIARRLEERRVRDLVTRYPSRQAHDAARRKALDEVRAGMKASELRSEELKIEREHLLEEMEFYPDQEKAPPLLRQRVEANEALLAAQSAAYANREAALKKINDEFDRDLATLQKASPSR